MPSINSLRITAVSGAISVANTAGVIPADLSGALLATNNLSDLTSVATARLNLGLGSLAEQLASAVNLTGGAINGTQIGTTAAAAGAFTTLRTSAAISSGGVLTMNGFGIVGLADPSNAQDAATKHYVDAHAGGSTGALLAANNLSDLGNVATARGNLGLGTMATQSAFAIALTGGSIDNTAIGSAIPAAARFSFLSLSGTQPASFTLAAPTAATGAPVWRRLTAADVVGIAALDAPVFTTSVTLPSWASAPSSAAGLIGFNTTTGRLECGVGGATVSFVRLSGDTVSGALVVSGALSATGSGTGLAVTHNATIGGNLTVSGTTSATGALTVSATGTGLQVTHDASVGGNLSVSGVLLANSSLAVNGLGTALQVANGASVGGTLVVGGDTVVTGQVSTGGSTLWVGTNSVNNLRLQAAAAGIAPAIKLAGSDANIDLNIVPQGTGVLKVNAVPVAMRTPAGALALPAFTVAALPASQADGSKAWASNGRVGAETTGNGTGVEVVCKAGVWLRCTDYTAVAA